MAQAALQAAHSSLAGHPSARAEDADDSWIAANKQTLVTPLLWLATSKQAMATPMALFTP